MNRRGLLGSIIAGSTVPLSACSAAESTDLTSTDEMPDYCALAETREEAVCAWAGEHVQNARVALVSSHNRDPAAAKAELKAALELLERELENTK